MKTLKIILLFICVSCTCFSFSQTFVKHYVTKYADSPISYGHTRFSCITSKSPNFLIAGSIHEVNLPGRYAMVLVEIDASGNFVKQKTIEVNGTSTPVAPMGILYDISNGPKTVVVAGYLGSSPSTSNAFVLSYNYSTATVNWVTVLSGAVSSFFDLDYLDNDNYVVCGQVKDNDALPPDHYEEAVVYRVNKNTGVMTKVYMGHQDATTCSDTYYGLSVNGNQIVTSSRYEIDNLNYGAMRPSFTYIDTVAHTTSAHYYLKDSPSPPINAVARLYGTDMTRQGNTYFMAVTGDIDNINLNQDLFVVKANNTGGQLWESKVEFPDLYDGCFNSIKVYTTGIMHGNSPIVFGTSYEGGLMLHATLTRLTGNGSAVSWSNRYADLNTFGTLSPNAMILSGDKIYAVGWSSYEFEIGAVLCTSVTDGVITGCNEPLNPSIVDYNVDVPHVVADPNLPFTKTNPATGLVISSATVTTICETLLTHGGGADRLTDEETKPGLLITDVSPGEVVFSIKGDGGESAYSFIIYDMLGRTFESGLISAGEQKEVHLLPGIYIYTLFQNGQTAASESFAVK